MGNGQLDNHQGGGELPGVLKFGGGEDAVTVLLEGDNDSLFLEGKQGVELGRCWGGKNSRWGRYSIRFMIIFGLKNIFLPGGGSRLPGTGPSPRTFRRDPTTAFDRLSPPLRKLWGIGYWVLDISL